MRYSILVVILAITVGGLYATPQLFIRQAVVEQELPFILSQFINLHDGGDAYFQFAREVVDGHFPPSNIFFDYRTPNIFPYLSSLFLASIIFLFRDINIAYIVANFLFSSILFLLFLFLGWVVFNKNKAWSIFMGLVGTLTPMAIHLPYAFFSIDNFTNIVLKNFYPGIKTFLPTLFLARIEYPLMTYLIYLPAIITFFVFWQKPKFITAILAGLFSGLLFYTYFHKWVYWVVVIGLVFLYTLIWERQNKRRLTGLVILIGTMILISIPYFVNYFEYSSWPGAPDHILRLQLEMGHSFNWSVWPNYVAYLLLGVLVYLVFWRKRELRDRAILYWVFLVSAFLVWNVQIVTGFVPHPDHWPRAISPLTFLMFFDLVYTGIKRFQPGLSKSMPILITMVLVLMSALLVVKKVVNALGFVVPPQNIFKDYTLPGSIVSSWRWLDINYDESKIISPSFISSIYLPAFTSARPYLPWGGMISLSNFDLEELFLKSNKVLGVDSATLEKRLRDGQGLECRGFCDRSYIGNNIKSAPAFLYGLYFVDGVKSRPHQIPEYKIQELVKRYGGLQVSWENLDANYVYYGPWERQFIDRDLNQDQKLQLVYKNSLVELYKIK
ncbi:MAG: hypothetical protein Q8Q95_01860 [bacterium]|nr:hypothetical protein [bacterium]